MAVTTSRLVGTGSSYIEATKDFLSKFPKGKKFTQITTNKEGDFVKYSTSDGKSFYFYIQGTLKTTGDSTYKHIVNVAQSANGIFFYKDDGTAIGCLITMSDDTEFYVEPSSDYTTYNGGTLHKVYVPTSYATDYVIMCPIIYQDTSIGKVGADSGDVLFVEGISNSVWSPNGVKINGHTYYGCGKYCTRAD